MGGLSKYQTFLLLHFYAKGETWDHTDISESDENRSLIFGLCENGYLKLVPKDERQSLGLIHAYDLTEKGLVYLDQLSHLETPVQQWVIPK